MASDSRWQTRSRASAAPGGQHQYRSGRTKQQPSGTPYSHSQNTPATTVPEEQPHSTPQPKPPDQSSSHPEEHPSDPTTTNEPPNQTQKRHNPSLPGQPAFARRPRLAIQPGDTDQRPNADQCERSGEAHVRSGRSAGRDHRPPEPASAETLIHTAGTPRSARDSSAPGRPRNPTW